MNAREQVVSRAAKPPVGSQPLLLNNRQCARFMGIGRDRFYELRKLDPNFPKPVVLPGSVGRGGHQLRFLGDVERYVRELARAQRADEVDASDNAS